MTFFGRCRYVLADDYGWNDIGYHQNTETVVNPSGAQTTNVKIETPEMDRLAAQVLAPCLSIRAAPLDILRCLFACKCLSSRNVARVICVVRMLICRAPLCPVPLCVFLIAGKALSSSPTTHRACRARLGP